MWDAITLSMYDDLKANRANCERPYEAAALLRAIADKIEKVSDERQVGNRVPFVVKDVTIDTYQGYATAYIEIYANEG